MRSWSSWPLALVVAAVTACASGGDGSSYSGVVVGTAEAGPEGSDRWVLTVELDEGTVASSQVVQVAFDTAEIACDDGRAVAPVEVPVGSDVRFVRVGDEADTMAPPVVGGREVRVDCQADGQG